MTKRMRKLSKMHTRRDLKAVLGPVLDDPSRRSAAEKFEAAANFIFGDVAADPNAQYPCTQCGQSAIIGYGAGWDGRVKEGERLCTRCFAGRGGARVL